MIIDISTSSDSDETKYPEDNLNNAWQTVTNKRKKKKAPDTKRGKKVLKTSETPKELVASNPRLQKRPAPIATKLSSEPPPVYQMEIFQITEKGESKKRIRMFGAEELNNIKEEKGNKVKVLSSEMLVAIPDKPGSKHIQKLP